MNDTRMLTKDILFPVVAAKNYGRKIELPWCPYCIRNAFTDHHYDIRSDACLHASGRVIFYGHEPRL